MGQSRRPGDYSRDWRSCSEMSSDPLELDHEAVRFAAYFAHKLQLARDNIGEATILLGSLPRSVPSHFDLLFLDQHEGWIHNGFEIPESWKRRSENPGLGSHHGDGDDHATWERSRQPGFDDLAQLRGVVCFQGGRTLREPCTDGDV